MATNTPAALSGLKILCVGGGCRACREGAEICICRKYVFLWVGVGHAVCLRSIAWSTAPQHSTPQQTTPQHAMNNTTSSEIFTPSHHHTIPCKQPLLQPISIHPLPTSHCTRLHQSIQQHCCTNTPCINTQLGNQDGQYVVVEVGVEEGGVYVGVCRGGKGA